MRPRLDAQIMPLFALFASLVLLPLAALTLDGGTLYLQRRTAQNAADAAALAGARALQHASASPAAAISTEICKYVRDNAFGGGQMAPTASWYFVGTGGANSQAPSPAYVCPGNATPPIPSATSGVHVDITIGPYNTYLAGIVGVRQLTAKAGATAQLGGVSAIPAADLTPLAGCGPDMLFDGKSSNPFANILVGDGSVATPYAVNSATPPMGDDLVLQGSQLGKNSGPSCPGGASWKGKIDTSGVVGSLTLPAQLPSVGGNGNIDGQIAAGCTATGQADPSSASSVPPDVCLLLVPISAPPNPAGQVNIVTVACFSMYTGNGTEKWRGVLHPTADCPYGVYSPNSTWVAGSSSAATRVTLTH